MLDFKDISVLSFDCYGTLIDWEGGILSALEPLLSPQPSPAVGNRLAPSYMGSTSGKPNRRLPS